MQGPAVFYFDLASPYAYLASTRVERELGDDVIWRPILVGALYRHYRRAGWGTTAGLRERGSAEIEARAAGYGLRRFTWPDPYPANSLTVMRAAVWAGRQGDVSTFAKAGFALAFEEGIDLTDRSAVLEAGRRAGLDDGALDEALDDPEIKRALKDANDRAIAEGVYGVPTFDAGGLLWWGDHQLEAAVAAHRRSELDQSQDRMGARVSDP